MYSLISEEKSCRTPYLLVFRLVTVKSASCVHPLCNFVKHVGSPSLRLLFSATVVSLEWSGDMSHQEPGTASDGRPGLEPTDAADSTSATLLAAGNPNPFWSEMAQAEFRLLAPRPDFLGNETVEGRMFEQADAKAWRLPVRDDTSIVDEHPPYDAESEKSWRDSGEAHRCRRHASENDECCTTRV